MDEYSGEAEQGKLSSDPSGRTLLGLTQTAVSPRRLGGCGLLGRAEHLNVRIRVFILSL